MDQQKLQQELKSSSSSSTETSQCQDYLTSYTQISQLNHNEDASEKTSDIDSDSVEELCKDESISDEKVDGNALPELSSQIVEWSRKVANKLFDSKLESELNNETTIGNDEQLRFLSKKLLKDLDSQSMEIAQNLNMISNHLNQFCHSTTSNSLHIMNLYQNNIMETCDSIDSNIKLIYKIISKCDQLNKSLKFLDELIDRIENPLKLAGERSSSREDNELKLLEETGANQNNQQKVNHSSREDGQTPNKNNVEHVYVWDCYKSFCVSNNRLMNRIITWTVIFFNVLLFMMSGVILGIGIWLIADPKSYEPSRFLDTYNVIHAAYIMIIISSFTFALCVFGHLAIRWQNIYMIILYLVFLLICFGMQVAIVTLVIFRGYGTRLYIFAYKELLRELQQYNYQADARSFIDFFQIKLHCCGVESFNDYARYGMAIPVSCYMAGNTYLNERGCALALRQHYELRTAVVGFLCFFNGWIHLIIVLLLFFLLFCRKY